MNWILRVKNKEGFFPKFILILGILLIIIGLLNLLRVRDFSNDYMILSLTIALIPLGIFTSWIGYALIKYGRLSISPSW
ncbi:Uncharacterised protein [uncultured archaeon]|nr:Uncharacterised protein [uncultured archaeon]